ncbi:MAG: hypothetical protein KBD85_00695 [Elusimicrobia bacterium]|nr:hypothetical protein [Elusimicrobiota bacterium]MBP9128003.1 hypothetical protein [Elusimicrobiota bacterium]MBP9698512.1 hypothetical protein [Elusimicrobiota bacterium]
MELRTVVGVLLVLAGPILAFEAYGLYRLTRSIPPTPESALERLCADLVDAARSKNLDRSAKEIAVVQGPVSDPFFENLPPFLNARLSTGFKTFLFSDEVRKKSVAETARLLETNRGAVSSDRLASSVPDVHLYAQWQQLDSPDEVELTIQAVRTGVSGDGVQATTRFVHPRAHAQRQRRRELLKGALFAAAAPLGALAFLSLWPRRTACSIGGTHGPTS